MSWCSVSHEILSLGLCIGGPIKESDKKLMPSNLLTKVKNYSFLKRLQLELIPVRSEDHLSCFVDELAKQNSFQREISKFASKSA